MRFTELRDEVDGLTQNLRMLERNGLVERCVHPTGPPRVEYTLTEAGQALQRAVDGMCGWTLTHALAELTDSWLDIRRAGPEESAGPVPLGGELDDIVTVGPRDRERARRDVLDRWPDRDLHRGHRPVRTGVRSRVGTVLGCAGVRRGAGGHQLGGGVCCAGPARSSSSGTPASRTT